MNYYYEIDDRVKGPFNETWRWWCLHNCSPASGGRMPWHLHDEFVAHSTRVWLENANGVYQIKPDWHGVRNWVSPKDFAIIKLKAKTIQYEQG